MKIPLTDKFLLNLLDYMEKLDSTFDIFSYRTMQEAYCPDLYALKNQYNKQKNKQKFSQLIYRLKKNGYIKIKNLEQNKGIILTEKGAEKVLKLRMKKGGKRKRSDGKWQMIIFDVPENKRYLRNLLREKLLLLEYQLLQKSIWVCPYDVAKETEYFLRKYSLDSYVKLFLIEEISL